MQITVEALVHAPLTLVWDCWTKLEHINHWAFASQDWQAEAKLNDLVNGGKFSTIMSAKDGSASFDFAGTYTNVIEHELIEYDLGDERHVKIVFTETPEGISVVETFDPEKENPEEMQRAGWQAFMDNFKQYVESKN